MRFAFLDLLDALRDNTASFKQSDLFIELRLLLLIRKSGIDTFSIQSSLDG